MPTLQPPISRLDRLPERMADGTVLTYGHGALAICKFLADRGHLHCDLALVRLHLRDALPRAMPGARPTFPICANW